MTKGVIFDMDGVLVDNMEVHYEVFRIFCQKYGYDVTRARFDSFAGMGNDRIMPLALPADIIEQAGIDALADEKEALYREYYSKTIEPNKGLVSFLESLKNAGIKMAVGSSGQKENVDFVLDKCGIREYFDAVIDGDMVDERKPAPDIFLLAASRMGLEPGECIVIEDALSGIEAARKAGMKVIALTTTLTRQTLEKEGKPDMIITDFTEISPFTLP